jgi:cytochrome P450
MLLLAVDEEGDGGLLTDEQARDQSMTLLIAGYDTTAAGLTWLFYCLARQPQDAALVHQELDAVLCGREPTTNDLPHLSYTERVVEETLRLYPPAIAVFMRQTLADVEIVGYTLPRDSLVQLFPYICQHDPRWFPEPERFDPDRFLPERQRTLPTFAYFPFGGGPRVCSMTSRLRSRPVPKRRALGLVGGKSLVEHHRQPNPSVIEPPPHDRQLCVVVLSG